MRKAKLLSILLALAMVLTALVPATAQAAGKTVTVGTQAELEEALKDPEVTKIAIKAKKGKTLTIPEGDYEHVALVVDAAKVKLNNYGTFRVVKVRDAKKYMEYAAGNTIKVTDDKITVGVEKGAEIKALYLSEADAENKVVIRGEVKKVTVSEVAKVDLTVHGSLDILNIKKAAEVAVTGTTEETITVNTAANSYGAKVETAVAVDVKAKDFVEVVINEGAEDTTIVAKTEAADVKVENKTEETVKVEEADGTIHEVTNEEIVDTRDTVPDTEDEKTEDDTTSDVPVVIPPVAPPIVLKTPATLSTDIGTKTFVAGGDWVEFTFTTTANDDAGVMVYGGSDFGVAYEDKIAALEYKYGENWIDMKGQDFGGASGFPMADATSTFRVKFTEDAAGNYTFTAAMKKVADDSIVCELEVPFAVEEPKTPATLSTDIGTKTFVAGGDWVEFTFTTTANDDAGVMVYGGSDFGVAYEDKIAALEYKYGENWIDMKGQNFGGATGFPMADATSTFRVKFTEDAAGNYTFTAAMKKVADDSIVCELEVPFTVEESKTPAVLSTNIDDQTFVAGGDWVEFTFTTTANDDAGVMVYGGSDFGVAYEDKIAALEYKYGENWIDMKGQNFGGATGFPMADATSTFRVKFTEDAAGNYTFTAAMKKVADDSIVCELEVPFAVEEPKTPATLSTDIGTKTFVAGGDWVEFTFTTTANDDAGLQVYGGSDFGVAYEDKIAALEYKYGETWLDMKGQNFGGASGFPMADATSTFRVKFTEDAEGTYNFTAAMKKFSDNSVVCEIDVPFTVGAAQ